MRIASLKSLALWIAIGVIIIALIASFYPFTARANVYHLYASACLGGWENTHLATGLPQAFKNEKGLALTSDNSARLNAGTLARIYCGGFTGDILVDTIPTRILTRFSWAMEYPGLQIEEVPAPKTEPSINEDLMQEVNALLEEMASEPPTSPQPQEYPITQDVYEPIVQEPKQQAEEQAESPVAPETLESASVILKPQTEAPTPLLNPFEAIPREEEQTTEITETQNESLQNEPTPETPTTISTEAPVTIIRTEAPINDIVYGLLEVTYTLDGIEWKRLGFVRANEFHNKYFEIPIEEASDWEDISKIQISVQGVPTLDSLAPTIYLDAIWLEVEYQKPIEDELVKDPLPPPGSLEGDVIISRILHEQMTAVLVSRKSGPLPGDTKNELWIASASPDADLPFMTEWRFVAEDAILSDNPRITFSDGNLFWVGKNDENAWRFNPSSGGYESISGNPGESIELFFDDRSGEPHKLQVSPEGVLEILEIIEVSDEQIIAE